MVVVLGVRVVVSVVSVVSGLVDVDPCDDDDESPGFTSHQMPTAPRTRTITPAAAAMSIHGALLAGRGGPGDGAAVHIGPLGGPLTGGGGVWKATGREAGCGAGVAANGGGGGGVGGGVW